MNLLTIMAMADDWMFKFIRSVAMSIDTVIYGFMERVYELLIMISEAGIFSQATIQTFASRIYVFLGLVMIFRVSISLITYIIDPSNFSDKSVGGPALIKNIAFVLVGIVLIPYVFEAAYGLQRIVLKDNVIGNLILGMNFEGSEKKGSDSTEDNSMSTEDKDASYYAEYGGKIIAFQMFSSFFTFNSEIASPTCINQPVKPDGSFNAEACGSDKGIQGVPFSSGIEGIDNAGDYIAFAYKSGDFRTLANADLSALVYKSTNGDYPLFDYYFLPSAIIGIIVIILLLSFCIDISVRSVKLGFLQLIAPVPLIMRIDPKVGKTKFDNWVKECASTYLDLFTRLAALYFTIFIIAAISRDGIQNIAGSANNVQTNIFVKIFIIVGALFFAKQLPQLIYDIIGGKKDSMGTSKFKSALGGGLIGGATALGLGMAANRWAQHRANQSRRLDEENAIAKYMKDKNVGYDIAKNNVRYGTSTPGLSNYASRFKSGLNRFGHSQSEMLLQGASAAGYGGLAGYKGGNMSLSNAFKSGVQGKTSAREGAYRRDSYRSYNQDALKNGGTPVTAGQRFGDMVDRMSGVYGSDSSLGREEKEGKAMAKLMDNINKEEMAASSSYSDALSALARQYNPSAVDSASSLASKGTSYADYTESIKNDINTNYTIDKYFEDNNIDEATMDVAAAGQQYEIYKNELIGRSTLSREDYDYLNYTSGRVQSINERQSDLQDDIDKNSKLQSIRKGRDNK